MPPRRPGTLLPIETAILGTILTLHRAGTGSVHGFALAQAMRAESGARRLTAHGTLYKALGRLESAGLLTSEWEDATAALGRPRRRLYRLTGEGVRVASAPTVDDAIPALRPMGEPA
jgi:PadR family transcriptional regulator, regulatory protein PadR